jgi:predicted nucleic acid-binding protein
MPEQNNIHRITEWKFSPDDRLLFDTNIWMLLFGLQGDPSDTDVGVYSSAYKKILQAKSSVLTDSLIMAEFANAALRVRHELAIRFYDAPTGVKNYRDSEYYPEDTEAICGHLKEIREKSQVLNLEPPDDWDSFFVSVQAGSRDFNDEMIVLQCRRHNTILVTHDRDFDGCDIPILTNRSTYFRRTS